MNKLEEIYNIAMMLFERKEELVKTPDAFIEALQMLKKAKSEYEKAGMSIVDDPNADLEDDDAAKWLKEKEAAANAGAAPDKAKKVYGRDWQPRPDYSDKEKQAIDEHMKNGYSHREAERLAGAHKGPTNFKDALSHSVNPSMPSDKMLQDLLPMSKEWLANASMKEKMDADPEKNPMKYASGKLSEAHGKHTADYSKAFNEFLNSDKVKGLSARDRHKATQEFKAGFHKENPEYKEGLTSGVSNVQKEYGEAKKASEGRRQEQMAHILTGGMAMPSEISQQEAMQHIGGAKDSEGMHTGSIIKDPSAVFAERNPLLMNRLNDKQKERMKRVDSAASSQGVVRIRKKGENK